MSATRPSKVLLVTGGSGGIGRAISAQAVRAGFSVCIHYHSHGDKAHQFAAEMKASGGRAIAVGGDLTSDAEVRRLFAECDRQLGRLDALVNCAGTVGWQDRVDTCSADQLNALWAINITSYFTCAREAVLRLSTRHGGRGGVIVNVSSIAGRRGGREERVHYAASKGAINTFTLGLAKEVAAEGIRVNAVLPGFILSEFHDAWGGEERARMIAPRIPMGRVGTPEEVADAVSWLLSDRSSFVTSTLVDIAGGS